MLHLLAYTADDRANIAIDIRIAYMWQQKSAASHFAILSRMMSIGSP